MSTLAANPVPSEKTACNQFLTDSNVSRKSWSELPFTKRGSQQFAASASTKSLDTSSLSSSSGTVSPRNLAMSDGPLPCFPTVLPQEALEFFPSDAVNMIKNFQNDMLAGRLPKDDVGDQQKQYYVAIAAALAAISGNGMHSIPQKEKIPAPYSKSWQPKPDCFRPFVETTRNLPSRLPDTNSSAFYPCSPLTSLMMGCDENLNGGQRLGPPSFSPPAFHMRAGGSQVGSPPALTYQRSPVLSPGGRFPQSGFSNSYFRMNTELNSFMKRVQREEAEIKKHDCPKVELAEPELWNTFHKMTTEMVITKSGR